MTIYIFSGVFIYLIIGFVLFFLQRSMTFNKCGKPQNPEKYGLYDVKEIFIKTVDDINLLAWYKKPKKNNPLLIYFHGNSYDIGERAYRVKRYINSEWGVLLLAWRGYSGNKGVPTEKNLYIDGESAINWVKNNTNIKFDNIILYGESLGCGVAVQIGTKHKFKSIILEAPFTSIADIGQKRFPIYPVKYLTLDKFDNLKKINNITSPILIIHGKKDEIIPFNHSLKLFKKANFPKKYLVIDEAMHNNLYDFYIDKKVIQFNSSL